MVYGYCYSEGGGSCRILIHNIVNPAKVWRANLVELLLQRVEHLWTVRVEKWLAVLLLSRVSAVEMRHRSPNHIGHLWKSHALEALSRLGRKYACRIGEELMEAAVRNF